MSAISPEVHGSRRTLNRWHPATTNELAEYIGGCISRLAELASRNDEVSIMCRKELGGLIGNLVGSGFIGCVEDAIRRVAGRGHRWTLALRQLHGALVHFPGSIDEATTARVRSLIDLLTPTDLCDRVRALVTEPPMPHDWVTESVSVSSTSRRFAPRSTPCPTSSCGHRRLCVSFSPGSAAGRTSTPVSWESPSRSEHRLRSIGWTPIIGAVEHEPETQRNHALFVGFVAGLTDRHRADVEAVKQRVIESPGLAPVFPEVCRRIGLTTKDVAQGVEGLAQGTIPSSALMSWTHSETLDPLPRTAVARLLDALLDHHATSFAIGVNTLWMMLCNEDRERKDTRETGLRITDFRPQVLTMARNAGRWERAGLPSRNRDNRSPREPRDDRMVLHPDRVADATEGSRG